MISAIERAFEHARSGKFTKARDIDRVMKQEGYTHAEIASLGLKSVRRDLLKACSSATACPATHASPLHPET